MDDNVVQSATGAVAATNRFSRAVAATASSLISSKYPGSLNSADILLASNPHYQKVMTDITLLGRGKPASASSVTAKKTQQSVQKKMFALTRTAPSEVWRNAVKNRKRDTRYDVLMNIPDEMLETLPDNSNAFSLFQGFNAVLPEVNEEIEIAKHGSDAAALLTNGDETGNPEIFRKPKGLFRSPAVTMDKIRQEESTENLKSFKSDILHHMDLLEVRKGLAANEIEEIDARITKLQSMREIVFDRVAGLEQEEILLDAQLQEIEARLGEAEEEAEEAEEAQGAEKTGKGKSAATSKASAAPQTSPDSARPKESSPDWDDSQAPNINTFPPETDFLSQSIYGKLQQSAGPTSAASAARKDRKFRKRTGKSSRRKTMPTLQQYYEPGSEIRTFQAHDAAVTCFDFDIPFGTLVSASGDETVRIWDLSRARCAGLLEGHHAAVSAVQMEDSVVVTGSADTTLKLWDLSRLDVASAGAGGAGGAVSSPLVHSFESHVGAVTALHFHKYTLVSGSADKTIREWDLQTGRCRQTMDVLWAAAPTDGTSGVRQDSGAPFIAALQCYESALASGSADGVVRLWDLRAGQVHRSLAGHTDAVTCLQFDEHHLVTGSLDRFVRIWDLRMGTVVDGFSYDSPVTCLHFDARRIVTATRENTVRIYDRGTEKHWSCGAGAEDSSAAVVNYVRYREGYLVEGRADGKIGTWAC